jgi:hypothetical protein
MIDRRRDVVALLIRRNLCGCSPSLAGSLRVD